MGGIRASARENEPLTFGFRPSGSSHLDEYVLLDFALDTGKPSDRFQRGLYFGPGFAFRIQEGRFDGIPAGVQDDLPLVR